MHIMMRSILITAVLLVLTTQANTAYAEQSTSPPDETVIDEVFQEVLLRAASPEDLEEWKTRVSETNFSRDDIKDALRGSSEYKRLKKGRDHESKHLVRSTAALLFVLVATYFLVVRKRPERQVLFLLFVLLITPFFLNHKLTHYRAHFGDLRSFYYGADYIYNLERSPYGNVLAEEVEEHIFPFFHPPPCVVIFYPFTHMSYYGAKVTSAVGNQLALVLLVYLLVLRDRRNESQVLSICLLVYILSFHAVWLTLLYGQLNFWTTVFICLFIRACWKNQSNAWTGLTLTFAMVWKIYPGLLIAYLVLKRKWGAIAWCLGGLAAFFVLGLVTIPWEIWESWWATVGSRAAYGSDGPVGLFSPAGPWNQGLNGIFNRIFTNNQFNIALVDSTRLAKLFTYGLSAVFAGICAAILWSRNRRGIEDEPELEMGYVLALMSVIVPLSWTHHYIMLLPAIAAGTRYLFKHPRPLTITLFCLSAFGLAWDWSIFPQHMKILKGGASILLGNMQGYALIGLMISIALMLSEPLRKTEPSRE